MKLAPPLLATALLSISSPCAAQTKEANPVYIRVDKPASIQPGQPSPEYPRSLHNANVAGEVAIMIVIDTLGRAEVASMKVVKSTHDFFTAAVRDRLSTLRFDPAILAGKRVRQFISIAFAFTADGTAEKMQIRPAPEGRRPVPLLRVPPNAAR